MSYPHRPQVDLHTHTLASGHAYSTLTENAVAAAARGLRGIGMSDHGPALPGGPHRYHFAALRFIPPYLHGVRILRGVEANITGSGELDLDQPLCRQLDLVMAGFHEECGFDARGAAANTAAVLALMEQRRIHVLTHPGNPVFPIDAEAVARAGAATGVALEINNASFGMSRSGSSDNCKALARCCARFGTPVAIGSDAHLAEGIGAFEQALETALHSGIHWEQIVNRTLESTLAFLGLEG